MNLIKRNENPLDSLAKEFFGGDFLRTTPNIFMAENKNVGKINIIDNENDYIIQVSVPGFKKDEIEIDVNDDILIISSEFEKLEEENDNFYIKEFVKSSFSRSFYIPENVDVKKIDASMEDGILNVLFPKKEKKVKDKKINIKIK